MTALSLNRLVVVRHAKSDWPPGVPDRARPLAPRGQHDAPLMGRWINRVAGPIDVAVLSPAARVEQTWALLGAELDQVGVVQVDSRIYEAWGVHLVEVIRELHEDVSTVVVVGHEPGVSELSLTLANGHNRVLRRRISHKYPTCGVAVLESTLPWSDFVPACAELVHFVAPKDL